MKKMYLVTTDYPNSGPDSVFVLPEIPELAKRFDLTVICTGGRRDCAHVREGISYEYFDLRLTAAKKLYYILKYPFQKPCRKELAVIWTKHRREKRKDLLGRLLKSVEFYACAEEFYRFFTMKAPDGGCVNGHACMHRHTDIGRASRYKQEGRQPGLRIPASVAEARQRVATGFHTWWRARNEASRYKQEACFYTFWCNAYSLSLILHKKEYPGYRLFTRLHGYDLYEERYLYGRQPFKEVINDGLDKLFFVAQRPMDYYLEHHPKLCADKACVARLGVYGLTIRPDRKREGAAVLVSCSNVIALKRVHLIVEALALLSEQICWVHFGDGEDFGKVRELAKKKLENKENISYNLRGRVANAEVRRFYEENGADIFLTTSSTEGCPVSVMEALAAGLLVIGTAVGEIPSMIADNGRLLGENPEPEEVAEAIRWALALPEEEKAKMRESSRQLWENFYDAKKNAPLVAEAAMDR